MYINKKKKKRERVKKKKIAVACEKPAGPQAKKKKFNFRAS